VARISPRCFLTKNLHELKNLVVRSFRVSLNALLFSNAQSPFSALHIRLDLLLLSPRTTSLFQRKTCHLFVSGSMIFISTSLDHESLEKTEDLMLVISLVVQSNFIVGFCGDLKQSLNLPSCHPRMPYWKFRIVIRLRYLRGKEVRRIAVCTV